jgi:hypothetical protein
MPLGTSKKSRISGSGMKRFIKLLILTTIAMSLTSCVSKPYLDVGPVFVIADPNDVDMYYVRRGFVIYDPNDPGAVFTAGKDGRFISNKFFEYLLKRAAK